MNWDTWQPLGDESNPLDLVRCAPAICAQAPEHAHHWVRECRPCAGGYEIKCECGQTYRVHWRAGDCDGSTGARRCL